MKITRSPLTWVPTLYFMQGLPYAAITLMTVVMYKNFQLSNTQIAFYTSLLVLPWSLKPLWAPFLESRMTKRQGALLSQGLVVILLLIVAVSFYSAHFVTISLLLLAIMGLIGAIYDITSDGVYLVNLSAREQALYVGVRTCFYHLARFFCQGGLITLAGVLIKKYNPAMAWQMIYFILACTVVLVWIYHYFMLPEVEKHHSKKKRLIRKDFILVWQDFFKTPYLMSFIIFLFIYNFAEAQLLKIVPLFLLDPHKNGGLQFSTSELGLLLGGVGVLFIILGSAASGYLVSRYSLIKSLPPISFFAMLANVGYLWLSLFNEQSIYSVMVFIAIAQFAYGLSGGAYLAYLLRKVSRSDHAMSHFAIGTSLMAMGVAIPGAISGYIQQMMGYQGFFTWVVVAGLLIYGFTLYIVKHDQTLGF